MNDSRKPPRAMSHVNLNELPSVGCPNCSCQIFVSNAAMYKKVSAIQAGKAQLIRVVLNICQDCGALSQAIGDELKLVEVVPLEKEETDDGT